MSVSVCLSVCPRGYISGTTRAIFTKFFVHVVYIRGSVLLRHVDDRQGRSQKFVLWVINFYCTVLQLQSFILTSSAAISAQNNFQGLILGGYIYRYTPIGKALTIGSIAYRREGGDGSAQRGRSVIYDCVVSVCRCAVVAGMHVGEFSGRSSPSGPGVHSGAGRRLLRRERSPGDAHVSRGARHPDQRQVRRTMDQSHATGGPTWSHSSTASFSRPVAEALSTSITVGWDRAPHVVENV